MNVECRRLSELVEHIRAAQQRAAWVPIFTDVLSAPSDRYCFPYGRAYERHASVAVIPPQPLPTRRDLDGMIVFAQYGRSMLAVQKFEMSLAILAHRDEQRRWESPQGQRPSDQGSH